ncbi:MAG: hypothetical protein V7609_1421 [Verrucomicrobiota bacterium]
MSRLFWASLRPAVLLALFWCVGCSSPVNTGPVATVPVYYATTRKVAVEATPEKAFGTAAEERRKVNYGRALVELGPKARIVSYDPPLAGGAYLPVGKFYPEVRSQISSERPLIVYVHGFNNTFATAAHRAALFTHQLQPDAASRPAIYSWPSASKVLAYSRDEESALLNQDRIFHFLNKLHEGDVTTPAVLIGHSLGARALTYGLRDIFLFRAGGGIHGVPKQPMFSHLVLLEADVNRLYFGENLLRASALCGHITLYVSKRDRALGASTFVHGGYDRLGQKVPGHEDSVLGPRASERTAKKIDVIDASAVRSDIFGHAYDQPVLFEDLRALIRGKNAAEREGHTLEKDSSGSFYRLLPTPRT